MGKSQVRVDLEVSNGVGSVHVQVVKNRQEIGKYWYNPITGELRDAEGSLAPKWVRDAVKDIKAISDGLSKGKTQARELGATRFKVGAGKIVAIGAAAGLLLDFVFQEAALASFAAESSSYKRLMAAIQGGGVSDSATAAERFYEDAIGAGIDPKAALGWKRWFDETVLPEFRKHSIR